jgi:hypothetical protein
MDYLADVLACGGMVALELIGVFVAALLIQGVVYWTTGFSIARYLNKKLIKEYL